MYTILNSILIRKDNDAQYETKLLSTKNVTERV